MKKLLLIACVAGLALASLSPASAAIRHHRYAAAPVAQSPGLLICGMFLIPSQGCSQEERIVGGIIVTAALGAGVGWAVGGGALALSGGLGHFAAIHTTAYVIGTGAMIGAAAGGVTGAIVH